jgi:hypothetical protein
VTEADDLRAENARLWRENQRLLAERQEADYHRRLAEQMQGSISWKLTSPLRDVKRLAMLVRSRLDDR